MSTAWTVVILNIHHRGAFGNKVPNWIREVVLNWLASIMLLKNKVNHNLTHQNLHNKVDHLGPEFVSLYLIISYFGSICTCYIISAMLSFTNQEIYMNLFYRMLQSRLACK